MKIYSMVRLGVTPEINAVSTILVGLVTLGVILHRLLAGNKNNKLSNSEQFQRHFFSLGYYN